MLQIKDICKEYRTGSLVQKALDHVSLNLRDNEFVAILGPSGSGKTTLLNIVGGLDRYDSGDLIIGMDQENLEDMYDICEGNDPYSGGYRRRNASGKKALREIPRISRPEERRGRKISLLLDYTDRPREVADPWYTGNFDATWRDVNEGIRGLLDFLDD